MAKAKGKAPAPPETGLDFTLPEHPDDTRKRLSAAGLWKAAYKIGHAALMHHLTTCCESSIGRLREYSLDERTEARYLGQMEILAAYPPPPDARPCESVRRFVEIQTVKRELKDGPKDRTPAQMMVPTAADMRRFKRVKKINHDEEVTWVYLHIEDEKCYPCHAPTLGAWTMLLEARNNKVWFYDKHYRPMAERQSKLRQAEESVEYKPSRQEKLACDDIRQMIEEALEAIK